MIRSSVKRLLRIVDLLAIDSTITRRDFRGAGQREDRLGKDASSFGIQRLANRAPLQGAGSTCPHPVQRGSIRGTKPSCHVLVLFARTEKGPADGQDQPRCPSNRRRHKRKTPAPLPRNRRFFSIPQTQIRGQRFCVWVGSSPQWCALSKEVITSAGKRRGRFQRPYSSSC
jgi:hypothetical protein